MKEKALIDSFRREMTEKVAQWLTANGEDVGYINSNKLNFPVLIGELEKWVEIEVKVPKGTKDEEYEGYSRRDDYKLKCAEKEEKAKKKAEEKSKKIERDKKRREKKED